MECLRPARRKAEGLTAVPLDLLMKDFTHGV